MNRTTAREYAMKIVFELDFHAEDLSELVALRLSDEGFTWLSGSAPETPPLSEEVESAYIGKLVRGIIGHLPEINEYIQQYSTGWNFNRISRVSAAILRISMFELLYMQEIPIGSSINEAVELAKKYDSEEAASFVNGVLGAFVRGERREP